MEEKEKKVVNEDNKSDEKKEEYYRSIYRDSGLTEEEIKELERVDKITGVL